ncbi:MAG: calcium-translocating P-type ATPase, PMCA-type [Muribaculaceae bacterium]|nr:calcium-translocating P-type ATPase, PMCA-type [Muribaculaceae bacterium]
MSIKELITSDIQMGLADAQVEESRRKYGSNMLTPPERTPAWKQFLNTFKDPLIIILLVALLLSVGIALYELLYIDSKGYESLLEPVGILFAIILATLVGFLVEYNANKKFDVLNKINDDIPVKVVREMTLAQARRKGAITQVPRRDIVVGDIVLVESGEKVPADGELIESVSLGVDESSFTGESVICHKSANAEEASSTKSTYPANKLLRGSNVKEGHGVMRVTAVGDNTEYGAIYKDAKIEHDTETPLMKQFDKLGKLIARCSFVAGAAIIIGRLIVYFAAEQGASASLPFIEYFMETVMLAVTLIVVSVPEGLPMSVTLSLALSMHRMLQNQNLVRKMHACETMGATTVICTDKTGTLTQNQMRVYRTHFYGLEDGERLSDSEKSHIVTHSLACNATAYLHISDNLISDNREEVKPIGNPTEGALLLWLKDNGVDYATLRELSAVEAQLPFSTENKYMATVISCAPLGGKRLLLVKGASEIIRNYCKDVEGGVDFDDIIAELQNYQNKAMRTLGFAYRILADDEPCPITDEGTNLDGLTFLGIVAISDPVREDVPAAINTCLDAGIQIKIVTGDTPGTAKEIGRQVGLWTAAEDDSKLILGEEFAALPDDVAARRAKEIKIMSRARPADKARLVTLLQKEDEVVAVTGDGTNDAPALNAAQVGLSMGDGTAVAKEASDITIIDNSFSSIVKAVMWGRSLYKNIQRFIIFQLTVNVAACMLVGIASFVSEKQPALTVTQMLWVNLIMDTFAALALASLPPSEEVMHDKPRGNKANIITRSMAGFVFGFGASFAIAMIGLFVYLLANNNDGGLLQSTISMEERTIFFTTFVFLQFWNMFNAKSYGSGHSAFHNIRGSRLFFTVAMIILVGQFLIVEYGGIMFQVTPLPLSTMLLCLFGTMPIMLMGELYHWLKKRK